MTQGEAKQAKSDIPSKCAIPPKSAKPKKKRNKGMLQTCKLHDVCMLLSFQSKLIS